MRYQGIEGAGLAGIHPSTLLPLSTTWSVSDLPRTLGTASTEMPELFSFFSFILPPTITSWCPRLFIHLQNIFFVLLSFTILFPCFHIFFSSVTPCFLYFSSVLQFTDSYFGSVPTYSIFLHFILFVSLIRVPGFVCFCLCICHLLCFCCLVHSIYTYHLHF